MAERGRVRRINSSASSFDDAKNIGSEAPLIWQRGQDHFSLFTKLITQELDDETAIYITTNPP